MISKGISELLSSSFSYVHNPVPTSDDMNRLHPVDVVKFSGNRLLPFNIWNEWAHFAFTQTQFFHNNKQENRNLM